MFKSTTITTAICMICCTLLHPAAFAIDLNDPNAGFEMDDRSSSNGNNGFSTRRIFFWSDTNFRGTTYTLHMLRGRCYPIDASYQNQFSSVDTNGECVDLFTRSDCFGAMYRMEALSSRCHRNLGDCDMNDAISSVRMCRETCYSASGANSKKELVRMLYELMREE